ncbi:MAG: aspartate carbamoyltransferase catalytic subunit [Opitutales bacterium]|nr:aspartate carbamoyltransferase catalytic subunit [Opitutales bacterium]NRA28409.1 aspartate carbamoyltransferase catalytic subunit [Opitutales bacterium]
MKDATPHWDHKDLISIEPLTAAEIKIILDTASAFKKTMKRSQKKLPVLRGKQVLNLFLEPSTRTRVAFETAATRLSADVIDMQGDSSSTVKGETLKDTARVIEALNVDMVVIRHSSAGSPLFISNCVNIPVINAGDGPHEHPTQALLDVFSLQERLGDLNGKKVTILGDILFSRVARSNIWALTKLGASVTVAGPATLVPEELASLGVSVNHDLRSALVDSDAVMLLRIQQERQGTAHFPSLGEYRSMYGLDATRAGWLKPGALIMHPGPINRGVEIDSHLADSPQSMILDQVHNGVAVRMAVLYLCAAAHSRFQLKA